MGTVMTTLPQHHYPPTTVSAVWEKAQKEFGFFFFRRDPFGKIIAKHEFGKKTQYGWEIVAIPSGNNEGAQRLVAVHWENVERQTGAQ